jgi:putative ATP-dependent endonuclease of OLD family
MHISELRIKGYKSFENDFIVKFNKSLTVLVGENGSGKSAVIDALRLLLLEDEYGRSGVTRSDFFRPIGVPASSKGADRISLTCVFDGLKERESVALLPWLDALNPERAFLNLVIENKENERGRFKRNLWGGESSVALFEWDLLDHINCVYLPALRDAEDRLNASRGSRLARVLKNLKIEPEAGQPHPLEKMANEFNEKLLSEKTIKTANEHIRKYQLESLGSVLGQDALIQFSETSFDRIVERLRLLFYPQSPTPGEERPQDLFRDLKENSLGYNNLLYLATVFAELEDFNEQNTLHKLLLIEEPEAHLHPQLQTRLLQYLQRVASQEHTQVIVTTHSPVIASSVSLDAINVLAISKSRKPASISLMECRLEPKTKFFLERWLDVTKSTLLFARGVLLVEGIAEALLLPELAKTVIAQDPAAKSKGKNLEDFGVSVISLGGNFFHHFVELFRHGVQEQPGRIPVRCAGLMDKDPEREAKPTPTSPSASRNPHFDLVHQLKADKYCRVFANLKTFEYDLAMEGNNLKHMSKTLAEIWESEGDIKIQLRAYENTDWSYKVDVEKEKTDIDKSDAAAFILKRVKERPGEFAQALACQLSEKPHTLEVPPYIREAVLWVI